MTYDGLLFRLFGNGSEVAHRQLAGAVVTSNGASRLGGNRVWGEWLSGELDDVRIYDVAIGSAQINFDMEATEGTDL
jgi:Concanavalin A-like lectin/glucanases superfamily